MNPDSLYRRHSPNLEDFWFRRQNQPEFVREYNIFGWPFRLVSNDSAALEAFAHASQLYTVAPEVRAPVFVLNLIIGNEIEKSDPLPENLFDYIQYNAFERHLTIDMANWGHCQVDLANRRALAVIPSELGHQPELVSRYLLNTILTNVIMASGFGMLHATALYRGDRAILLMAPHNSGKSTTALRLIEGGGVLISDSQIYIDRVEDQIGLYGFPVGQIRLRKDMLNAFPKVSPYLSPEPIRGETKYVVDLRRYKPGAVQEHVIFPAKLDIHLLSQNDRPNSVRKKASKSEVIDAIMKNSIFFDSEKAWVSNLQKINLLLENAKCYHLIVGADTSEIPAILEFDK